MNGKIKSGANRQEGSVHSPVTARAVSTVDGVIVEYEHDGYVFNSADELEAALRGEL